MKITAMPFGFVLFPRTLGQFHSPAVRKDAVVVHYKSILTYIEAHRSRACGVIRILNELVCKCAVSLQVAKLGAEIAKIINAARQKYRSVHLNSPSAEHKRCRSHSLQMVASGTCVTANWRASMRRTVSSKCRPAS